jgi:hypothetical protein
MIFGDGAPAASDAALGARSGGGGGAGGGGGGGGGGIGGCGGGGRGVGGGGVGGCGGGGGGRDMAGGRGGGGGGDDSEGEDEAEAASVEEALLRSLCPSKRRDRYTALGVGVDLHRTRLRDMDATLLGRLLKGSPLASLDLSNNRITTQGVAMLAWALHGNDCLSCLDLSSSRLQPKGAQALCEALVRSVCLRSLHIADNELRSAGAKHVAALLRCNGSITELGLANNDLTAPEPAANTTGALDGYSHSGLSAGVGRDFDGCVALCKAVYTNEVRRRVWVRVQRRFNGGSTELGPRAHRVRCGVRAPTSSPSVAVAVAVAVVPRHRFVQGLYRCHPPPGVALARSVGLSSCLPALTTRPPPPCHRLCGCRR